MSTSFPRRQLGLTLVELMVALVLGLVVIGAVVNLFLTNRQTYRATENLARMQENLRFAFELMARDVREAGATACGSTTVANVLKGTPTSWSWEGESLRAYGSCNAVPTFQPSNCAAGTPVLAISRASNSAGEVRVTDHDPETSATMNISHVGTIKTKDILFVCKGSQAAIFQATNVNAKSLTVVHQAGTGGGQGQGQPKPGNETKCLDFPLKPNQCKTSFKGGTLLRFERILWYLGNNNRNGTSLYRKVNDDNAIEMVPDIVALDFTFLSENGNTYQTIASVGNWTQVRAVRAIVTTESIDAVGTGGERLRRTHRFTVALRNRLP